MAACLWEERGVTAGHTVAFKGKKKGAQGGSLCVERAGGDGWAHCAHIFRVAVSVWRELHGGPQTLPCCERQPGWIG